MDAVLASRNLVNQDRRYPPSQGVTAPGENEMLGSRHSIARGQDPRRWLYGDRACREPRTGRGLAQALDRIEREHNLGYAKTSFEGLKTVRINNLLTYDDIFWEVPLHENVLPVVERVLDRECLLSSFCSLVLGPGQEAQPIQRTRN